MAEILQDTLPEAAHDRPPLPGVMPLEPDDWLVVDEVFAEQMAARDALVATRRDTVIACRPEGRAAADELLHEVLGHLAKRTDFTLSDARVIRPDGVCVVVDEDDPLGTLGRLVQEDFCLLAKQDEEHVLVAAVLCFPASWRLEDKIGRPLTMIHAPVQEYDANVARRVQRLFDGVRVGRPMRRQNLLEYATPDLHQPYGKAAVSDGTVSYLRSERQCVRRLARTGAVVFSIHTWVTRGATA